MPIGISVGERDPHVDDSIIPSGGGLYFGYISGNWPKIIIMCGGVQKTLVGRAEEPKGTRPKTHFD